jgi:hypothetical protein
MEETQNTVALSPEERAFISELQQQIQTACMLIIRQRKLSGKWTLEGVDHLVRIEG